MRDKIKLSNHPCIYFLPWFQRDEKRDPLPNTFLATSHTSTNDVSRPIIVKDHLVTVDQRCGCWDEGWRSDDGRSGDRSNNGCYSSAGHHEGTAVGLGQFGNDTAATSNDPLAEGPGSVDLPHAKVTEACRHGLEAERGCVVGVAVAVDDNLATLEAV